jgi:hypothetical protein
LDNQSRRQDNGQAKGEIRNGTGGHSHGGQGKQNGKTRDCRSGRSMRVRDQSKVRRSTGVYVRRTPPCSTGDDPSSLRLLLPRGSEQRPTSSDDNRHGPSLSFLSTQLCQARFSNPSCLFEDLKLVIRNRGGNAGPRGGNHGGVVGHGGCDGASMLAKCDVGVRRRLMRRQSSL